MITGCLHLGMCQKAESSYLVRSIRTTLRRVQTRHNLCVTGWQESRQHVEEEPLGLVPLVRTKQSDSSNNNFLQPALAARRSLGELALQIAYECIRCAWPPQRSVPSQTISKYLPRLRTKSGCATSSPYDYSVDFCRKPTSSDPTVSPPIRHRPWPSIDASPTGCLPPSTLFYPIHAIHETVLAITQSASSTP